MWPTTCCLVLPLFVINKKLLVFNFTFYGWFRLNMETKDSSNNLNTHRRDNGIWKYMHLLLNYDFYIWFTNKMMLTFIVFIMVDFVWKWKLKRNSNNVNTHRRDVVLNGIRNYMHLLSNSDFYILGGPTGSLCRDYRLPENSQRANQFEGNRKTWKMKQRKSNLFLLQKT